MVVVTSKRKNTTFNQARVDSRPENYINSAWWKTNTVDLHLDWVQMSNSTQACFKIDLF